MGSLINKCYGKRRGKNHKYAQKSRRASSLHGELKKQINRKLRHFSMYEDLPYGKGYKHLLRVRSKFED